MRADKLMHIGWLLRRDTTFFGNCVLGPGDENSPNGLGRKWQRDQVEAREEDRNRKKKRSIREILALALESIGNDRADKASTTATAAATGTAAR